MTPIQTHTDAINLSAAQPQAAERPTAGRSSGLSFSRHFTRPGISPFEEVTWELRDAVIHDYQGPHHLRAEERGSSQRLVDDRDQHRRLQVPARPGGHAGAGDRRARS